MEANRTLPHWLEDKTDGPRSRPLAVTAEWAVAQMRACAPALTGKHVPLAEPSRTSPGPGLDCALVCITWSHVKSISDSEQVPGG